VFLERLTLEFAARQKTNPRYSLRAFAAFLETDHATLSQVMRGRRRATVQQIRRAGKKLGLSPEEITVHLAAEHVPDTSTVQRQARLRHWTAEALALAAGRTHWKIVRLIRQPGFRADCRWIAAQVGAGVDEVNVALTRLLRPELIDGRWCDRTGFAKLSECEFRKLALGRVRRKAAEDRIEFGKTEE
jgi:hypothetical protein